MSVLRLPTYDGPFYSYTSTLDGITYAFEFRYNQTEDRWYFSIGLSDGTEIANGVKVVCQRSLLRKFADDRLPPGLLMAFPSGADASPPGLLDLAEGGRVSLYYLDADTVRSGEP